MPITIKVNKTGPLFISPEQMADVQIVDHEGNVIQPKSAKGIKLCRCGASSEKPFCDGTHSRIGFLAAEMAAREFDQQQQQQK
ncbi:MAG TPA: CDGSH iron-sulfur domain-containing protein [Gemmatimonadaceae bacterium]|nr:CDGSH iron-sulfur domain-containing protein [Gemmatimonadaceae bacterium]